MESKKEATKKARTEKMRATQYFPFFIWQCAMPIQYAWLDVNLHGRHIGQRIQSAFNVMLTFHLADSANSYSNVVRHHEQPQPNYARRKIRLFWGAGMLPGVYDILKEMAGSQCEPNSCRFVTELNYDAQQWLIPGNLVYILTNTLFLMLCHGIDQALKKNWQVARRAIKGTLMLALWIVQLAVRIPMLPIALTGRLQRSWREVTEYRRFYEQPLAMPEGRGALVGTMAVSVGVAALAVYIFMLSAAHVASTQTWRLFSSFDVPVQGLAIYGMAVSLLVIASVVMNTCRAMCSKFSNFRFYLMSSKDKLIAKEKLSEQDLQKLGFESHIGFAVVSERVNLVRQAIDDLDPSVLDDFDGASTAVMGGEDGLDEEKKGGIALTAI